MTKPARITAADILNARQAAEDAGLRLTGLERRPDGTLKLEFAEFLPTDDWRADSPLYSERP